MDEIVDVLRTAIGRAEHHDATEVRRRAVAKGVADEDAAKRVRDEVDAGRGFNDGPERGEKVRGDFVRGAVGGIGADDGVVARLLQSRRHFPHAPPRAPHPVNQDNRLPRCIGHTIDKRQRAAGDAEHSNGN